MTVREKEYTEIHEFVLKTAKAVKDLNLDKFIQQINVTEQVSPLLEPEMYKKVGNNLKKIKKLACSLRQFQLVLASLGD